MELLIRFLLGGSAVCLFAAIGDVARPKSFAGVFGAAPSVALATLALTIHAKGAEYTALEARSMAIGAVALLVYTCICRNWFWLGEKRVTIITMVTLAAWLAIAVAGGTLLWRERL
jgi:hypothetical protein